MSKRKILIVDDDKDLRSALNVRLRANNYDTAFAGDAISAIAVAKKENPDLIVLDLGLPAGDGFLIMQRIRDISELASTPIIILTAKDPHFPVSNVERARELGAKFFFQKPADNDRLVAAIQKCLGEGGK